LAAAEDQFRISGSSADPFRATMPGPITGKESAHYVVTTVDVRGRMADRSSMRLLDWLPGQSVEATISGGAALIVPRHGTPSAVTRQGHLRLPLAMRRALRIGAGDRLLLTICPIPGFLIAQTMSAVNTMILEYFGSMNCEAK
jgi:hypothetical protein